MNVKFLFMQQDYLEVHSVAVVGEFNDWDEEKNLMQKNEAGNWQVELELLPGTYRYRFLINDKIYLNDPSANLYDFDDNYDLMSCINIDEDGQRLYNVTNYSINLKRCYCTNGKNEESTKNKTIYSLESDEKILLHMIFTNVTGIHLVTVIWISEKSKKCVYSDEVLFMQSGEEEIEEKFALEFDDEGIKSGPVQLKIFIDGAFILERTLLIVESTENIKTDELLPLGSVVKLNGSDKLIIIVGRLQRKLEDGRVYHYSGFFYPEGNMDGKQMVLFSTEQIYKVIFEGYSNQEEQEYKQKLIEYLY